MPRRTLSGASASHRAYASGLASVEGMLGLVEDGAEDEVRDDGSEEGDAEDRLFISCAKYHQLRVPLTGPRRSS